MRLLTVHAAKGLEFPVVFVMRVAHPSFPSQLSRGPGRVSRRVARSATRGSKDDPKEVHKQEERRLFYVALTRAEDELVLCGKKGTGKKDPTPPGYLRELVTAGEKTLRGMR